MTDPHENTAEQIEELKTAIDKTVQKVKTDDDLRIVELINYVDCHLDELDELLDDFLEITEEDDVDVDDSSHAESVEQDAEYQSADVVDYFVKMKSAIVGAEELVSKLWELVIDSSLENDEEVDTITYAEKFVGYETRTYILRGKLSKILDTVESKKQNTH